MFSPYYECHITLEKIDRDIEQKSIEALKWKFSCIDGDPVLGKKPYSYATKHYPERLGTEYVNQDLTRTAQNLSALGHKVVRSKTELVVFDTKNYSCAIEATVRR